MVEQIFPEPLQCALVDMHHDHLLRESRGNTDPVEHGHAQHCAAKRAKIRIRLADHRRNVVVDQSPRKHRTLYIGND